MDNADPVDVPSAETIPVSSRVEARDVDFLTETHRREQFAHAVAFGVPIPQALVQAGYSVINPALGYSLLRAEDVVAIIDADRMWMREKLKLSQEQIIAQLDNDRSFAYACENPGAAVSATMAKAKVAGIADPLAAQGGRGMPKRVIIEWADGGNEELVA